MTSVLQQSTRTKDFEAISCAHPVTLELWPQRHLQRDVNKTVSLLAVPLPESVLHSLSKMQLPNLEKSEIGPDIGPEIGPEIGPGIGSKICPKIGPEVSPEIGQKSSIPVSLPLIIRRQASKEVLSENMEVIENINKNNQSVDEILVSEKGSKYDVQNTGDLSLL